MIPVFLAEREAGMRGSDERSGELFSYVDLEDRVPAQHPLRLIRRIVNEVLAALDGEFAKIYADSGRLWAHFADSGWASCRVREVPNETRDRLIGTNAIQ
jgi:hypothetical protein